MCRYDLISAFAEVMAANGVDIGFYYSLTNNFYLNVAGKVAKGSDGWLPNMAVRISLLPASCLLLHCRHGFFFTCRRTLPKQTLSASRWISSQNSGHGMVIFRRYGSMVVIHSQCFPE